ncbi:DUF6249 domain-containing protein [Chryseolinea sp. T2]|uniref:DUF6249 domain-containing protein n=1 Tax=Chryseolinea sp. T2 TaxID=3129255 RepID=UPI003076B6E0
MDVAALGVMVPIVALIGSFVMVVYLRKFENLERMSMIEKGLDPTLFRSRNYRNTSVPLRASLLLIGAGIGLLLGYALDSATYMDEVAYFSMLFVCGGAGLGLSYIIEERRARENKL